MNRRRFLAATLALASGGLAGCTAPTADPEPVPADRIYDHDGTTYHASPSEPDCPIITDGEVDGYHWGKIERSEYPIDARLNSPRQALDWADEEYSDPALVRNVDTIQWMGEHRHIPTKYDATDWYLVRIDSSHSILLIPRDDGTDVVEYRYGDC